MTRADRYNSGPNTGAATLARRGVAAWLCALLVLTGVARADWDSLVSVVSRAPGDAELVVAVEDAAHLRRTRIGEALTGVIRESGLLERTGSAWDELALRLGLSDDDAFDRLLGRRVVLIVRPGGAGRDWALISDVDQRTEALLRARLRPVPRRLVNRRPVYALENGAFELVTARLSDGRALFLITPRGSGLLGDGAAMLLDGTPALDETRPGSVEALRSLDAGDVAVLWRPEGGFAALSAEADGELSASMVSTPGLLWGPRTCCAGFDLWSGDHAEAICDGALLAAAGLMGSADDQIALASAFVRAGPLHGVIQQLEPWTGQRLAFAVRETDDGRVSVDVVSELIADEAGGPVDRAMALGARRLAQTSGGSFTKPPACLPDTVPTAIRTHSLGVYGAGLFGEQSSVSWTYAQRDGSWLVASIGPAGSNADEARRAAERAESPSRGRVRPRVSVGVVRPNALLRLLAGHGIELPKPLLALERIGSLRWDAWLDGQMIRSRVILSPP